MLEAMLSRAMPVCTVCEEVPCVLCSLFMQLKKMSHNLAQIIANLKFSQELRLC